MIALVTAILMVTIETDIQMGRELIIFYINQETVCNVLYNSLIFQLLYFIQQIIVLFYFEKKLFIKLKTSEKSIYQFEDQRFSIWVMEL